jgi:hypothetical protein
VWNRPVEGAQLDPRSSELVAALNSEVASEDAAPGGPRLTIDTSAYSVPIYTVPAGQPTVPVTPRNTSQHALAGAWSHVPLPADAHPANGSDGDLVVWQPSSDHIWEFWRLAHDSEGWRASWGGAIEHASQNPGVYGPEAAPGATRWWGTPATSLALLGGLITLEDLATGQINHALAISIPNTRAGIYALPAKRTDGTSSSPLALPEGAHLRLDPRLDLASLHLPHLTLLIAQAAQRYGLIIRDRSPNIDFYGQDPTPTATNPYTGPRGYLEGKTPNQTIASFPWQHLQLLTMELRRTRHRRRRH